MGKEINKLFSIIETLKSMTPSNFGLMLDIGKKLASAESATWATVFRAQLKAGNAEVSHPGFPAKLSISGMQHSAMQCIYDKYFPELDVIVPAFPDTPGKTPIYVAQGLTCDMIYAAWTFSKWKWCSGSIDAQLDQAHEARSSTNAYLVRVENGVEPDQKFLGRSTKSVDADGKIGITLRERMLLELMHFIRTREHLDVRGVTFCSGSRYRDGYVPGVYLGSYGSVGVGRCRVDDAGDGCGVRSAVLESL
jgi:hypothetical protein